jgi:hypothetical protein
VHYYNQQDWYNEAFWHRVALDVANWLWSLPQVALVWLAFQVKANVRTLSGVFRVRNIPFKF